MGNDFKGDMDDEAVPPRCQCVKWKFELYMVLINGIDSVLAYFEKDVREVASHRKQGQADGYPKMVQINGLGVRAERSRTT